jgi:tRNA(fMet)-specific endonuclease VapC
MNSVALHPTAVADTDVISLVFKRDTRAAAYRPHLSGHYVALSFMTVAELKRWSFERNWGAPRRQELDRLLGRFTIYHSNQDLCHWWGAVMAGAKRRGRRIEVADAWIAATALLHDIPLITHNPGDFAGVDGLTLITEA